jgi:hypothetical protein
MSRSALPYLLVTLMLACSESSQPSSGPGLVLTDGGLSPQSACIKSISPSAVTPSSLLLVLDMSGSMACNLPSDGQSLEHCAAFPLTLDPSKPSKWELTLAAVDQLVHQLQQVGAVSLGLQYFPAAGTGCSVAPDPLVGLAPLGAIQQASISDALGTLVPSGDTPLAGATILAYEHLLGHLKASEDLGNAAVVLVSDGGETCKPSELDKLINEDVPLARSIGIRTFVIGVPGSETARALLSRLAWEGGTAASTDCSGGPAPDEGNCHLDMTTSADFSGALVGALKQIREQATTCSLPVPQGDFDPTVLNLSVSDLAISRDDRDCATEANGWQYNDTRSAIRLCGVACTWARQPGATVEMLQGCPTQTVVVR